MFKIVITKLLFKSISKLFLPALCGRNGSSGSTPCFSVLIENRSVKYQRGVFEFLRALICHKSSADPIHLLFHRGRTISFLPKCSKYQ